MANPFVRHTICICTLFLCVVGTSAQTSKADSLYTGWLNESRSDSVRYEYFMGFVFQIIYEYPDSAIALIESELPTVRQKGLHTVEAALLSDLAIGYGQKGNNKKMEELLEVSYAVAVKHNNGPAQVIYHTNKGIAAFSSNESDKAIIHFKTGLELAAKFDYHKTDHNLLHNIGLCYANISDWSSAREYYAQSLALRIANHDSLSVAYSFNNIATTWMNDDGNDDSALYYLNKLVSMARAIKQTRIMGFGLINQSIVSRNAERFDQVLSPLLEARECFVEVNDVSMIERSHIEEGNYWLATEEYENAVSSFLTLKDTAEVPSNIEFLSRQYEGLSEAYKGLGQFELALEYLEKRQKVDNKDTEVRTAKELEAFEAEKQALQDSIAVAEEMALMENEHDSQIEQKNTQRNFLIYGGIALVLIAVVILVRLVKTRRAKRVSEDILDNVLPSSITDEIRTSGKADAKNFDQATILFSDFKGFTKLSEQLSSDELMQEIDTCFKAFDHIMDDHGIEKIKTIGDAYMAAGGLKGQDIGTPDHVIKAGLEMQEFISNRKIELEVAGRPAFEMRVGIHTGPVIAGIVGVKKLQYDVWGDTVNTASRMESSGEIGQVNISQVTYDLVKNQAEFQFTSRGKIEAKGKGAVGMYFVSKG